MNNVYALVVEAKANRNKMNINNFPEDESLLITLEKDLSILM